jgi:hypothetical protein
MHGFRCATEVITAWKLGHHADAKELCALYIQNGVPIYPQSLGHSYHTLVWRMGVEAKEMQPKQPDSANPDGELRSTREDSKADDGVNDQNALQLDPFFNGREEFRSRDDIALLQRKGMSYLEEKAQYLLSRQEHETDMDRITRTIRRQISMTHQPRIPAHVDERMPMASYLPPPQAPRRMHSSVLSDRLNNSRPQLVRSNSFTEGRFTEPRIALKIHRHLLDQHLLGKIAVNDENGNMITPPAIVSADFFHPHFSFKSKSSTCDSNQAGRHNNSLECSPSASMETGNFSSDAAAAAAEAEILYRQAEGFVRNSSAGTEDSDSDDDDVFGPRPLLMEPEPRNDDDEMDMAMPPAAPSFPPMLPPEMPGRSNLASPFRSLGGIPCQDYRDVLNSVDLDVYSASIGSPKNDDDDDHRGLLWNHLKVRFATYQRLLEKHLSIYDNASFVECILDFWDEFLPLTASIQYYDKHTPVPRLSCLQQFLSTPCPKAIGIVQCEIERIKVGSKNKGVNMKGRFFPTYEYRLFIRHRPADSSGDSDDTETDDNVARRDTVLMTARNKSRKSTEAFGSLTGSSSKKGANNYYLHLPQQEDVDLHYIGVNGNHTATGVPNGAENVRVIPGSSSLLGRLQSNFIGTEFQIFTPRAAPPPKPKPLNKRSVTAPNLSHDGFSSDDEGSNLSSSRNAALTLRKSRFRRLSLRGRNISGDGDPISPLALRRARSSGDLTPGKKPRHSRRVSAADSVESKKVLTDPCPLFYEEEDGAITYTANLLGSRPRIMDVCIPKVDCNGQGAEWKRYLKHSGDGESNATSSNRMLNHLKQLQQRGDGDDWTADNTNQADNNGNHNDTDGEYSPPDDFGLIALQNRPPWWNVELGSFVLNFGGRVSVASVKNFQLCDRSDQDYIMLQFGRIQGRHSFTMDFQYPLTGIQAFAIAISSLQSKISFG